MQAAQEFMTFLVDQTEHKLGEIKKATQSESTKFIADEVAIYVKKMREVISLAFGSAPVPEPQPPAPRPVGNRRGQRNDG